MTILTQYRILTVVTISIILVGGSSVPNHRAHSDGIHQQSSAFGSSLQCHEMVHTRQRNPPTDVTHVCVWRRHIMCRISDSCWFMFFVYCVIISWVDVETFFFCFFKCLNLFRISYFGLPYNPRLSIIAKHLLHLNYLIIIAVPVVKLT